MGEDCCKNDEDCCKEKDCECTEEDCDCMDTEEMVHFADDKVDALITLLIKKGVFSEEEFDKAYESLFEDSDDAE